MTLRKDQLLDLKLALVEASNIIDQAHTRLIYIDGDMIDIDDEKINAEIEKIKAILE